MSELKFSTTKNGKRRAYYYSRLQMRWFPMPVVDAEAMIAAGTGVELTGANRWPTHAEAEAACNVAKPYTLTLIV